MHIIFIYNTPRLVVCFELAVLWLIDRVLLRVVCCKCKGDLKFIRIELIVRVKIGIARADHNGRIIKFNQLQKLDRRVEDDNEN